MEAKMRLKVTFVIASIAATVNVVLLATVHTDQAVTGWKDEEVRLRCEFSEDPYAVFWSKIIDDSTGQSVTKSVLLNGKITDHDAPRFTMDAGNGLIIRDLRVADEGKYKCILETANGVDSHNFTQLTVNAYASRPVIAECDEQLRTPNPYHEHSLCTTSASEEHPKFSLNCKVTGFKPQISLGWYESEQVITLLESPKQRTLADDTQEMTITISVDAKYGVDQNFTCTATGVAVGGSSSAVITVLALQTRGASEEKKSTTTTIIWILVILLLIVFVGCCCVCCILYRRHGVGGPEGVCSWLLSSLHCLHPQSDLTVLREKINGYRRGDAAEIPNIRNDKDVNIALFGEVGAGKSTLINAIYFALKGKRSKRRIAETGVELKQSGKKKQRTSYRVEGRIHLVDSRGLNASVDIKDLTEDGPKGEILAQLSGERSDNPNQVIERSEEREIHCAVFVYNHRCHPIDEQSLELIKMFFVALYAYYGRSPLLVVRHDGPDTNLKDVESILVQNHVPKDHIQFIENFESGHEYEKNVGRDTELLNLLWAALHMCDLNIDKMEKGRRDKLLGHSDASTSGPRDSLL